ncbi:MAG: 4-hydroxythreonine-4-phosphate dehydrogenase PdxA [Cytophagales bacterium]|nr:MAG: 4-hydroxythreonine-4-phosphate dehydrogenase PdxA [Cytophagales bacterium]
MDKPIIGITLGDFNGIGPEVILKTLSDNRITKICTPVVYGSNKILSKYKKILHIEEINFHIIKSIDQLSPKKVNVLNCWEDDLEIQPGDITQEAGRCAFLSLSKATDDVIAKKTDAIVTAPINKKNIQSSEFNFPGHTEYFASKANLNDNLMLLVTENLRVGVATGHIPLTEIAGQLTKEKISSKINIFYQTLKKDFQILKPKIAILGVNPHAGESGLLGNEEQNILLPMIEEFKNKGMLVYGPFPADGFFGSGDFSKFDGILAMYHDQGLIPFKTLAFEQGVNYTAGMPFIRTSPDHGTAYSMSGKGIASESSFREALYLAIDICKNNKMIV